MEGEGEVVEMSKEELQKWIQDEVNKSELISPDVLKKCKLLQSFLERREKHAEHLLKLCQSVAACEAVVKKQYSLLGLEYNDDTGSADDDNIPDYGHSHPSPSGPFHSEAQFCSPPTIEPSPKVQKLSDRENPNVNNGKNSTTSLRRIPVVVLTRLPEFKNVAQLSSVPESHFRELKPLSSSESDIESEPEEDSSDLDFTGSNKKRKIDQKSKKPAKHGASPQSKKSFSETASPQAPTDRSAKSQRAEADTPEANKKPCTKTDARNTSTLPQSTNGVKSVPMVANPGQPTTKNNKPPPLVPQTEVYVKMHVLARKRAMEWQRGQIIEILTKDDGRVKYKVHFEEKGKSLVSGHHIAFDCIPNLSRLFVGARVVISSPSDQSKFWPGILAELPARKNRQRFLIFTDDQMSVYVGLPSLRLVCKPLQDPLDDILDDTYKSFIQHYLKIWPCPPQTQYQVGKNIRVECNGHLEKCEVKVVDCSIIQVVFQKDQHKEWIYRGSIRLEQMVYLKNQILKKINA